VGGIFTAPVSSYSASESSVQLLVLEPDTWCACEAVMKGDSRVPLGASPKAPAGLIGGA
jgi:hypothetical protein